MNFREKQQYFDHSEIVNNHIEQYFQDAEINIFHELPTLDIHLDVYHIKPNDADFDLLFSNGMSSIAMDVSEIPQDSDSYKFAELITMIPKGIDFGNMYPSKTPNDWVITMVKQVAKFPHFYDTWMGIGHTIQADDVMGPYSDSTEYCGCIILPTMSFPEEFQSIESKNGIINVYSLFPLYAEELQFKINNGYNDFADLLIENDCSEVIDFDRKKLC